MTSNNLDNIFIFEYRKNDDYDSIYIIDLNKYSISNDNTNATDTTKGISQALIDAKAAGYKRVKLPEGHYAIDTSVKNDKVYKNVSLNLATSNNLVYENQFIGSKVYNSGSNSRTYDNEFKYADITITSNDKNKYYNSNVGIQQNSNFPKLENNYF